MTEANTEKIDFPSTAGQFKVIKIEPLADGLTLATLEGLEGGLLVRQAGRTLQEAIQEAESAANQGQRYIPKACIYNPRDY